jgi:hypothetical protein
VFSIRRIDEIYAKINRRNMSLLVMAALAVSAGITTIGLLTPAGPCIGTWKTSFAVQFNVQTDFDGPMEDIGWVSRSMTWIVTPTGNPNQVDVEVQFSDSSQSIQSGKGYTPNVSPMFLEGVISGVTLTLIRPASMFQPERVVGIFTFTSLVITGTWDDTETLIYSQREYTLPSGLVLMKQ